jgi:hypothetical protein
MQCGGIVEQSVPTEYHFFELHALPESSREIARAGELPTESRVVAAVITWRKWKGIGRPTLLRRDQQHKPIPVRHLAMSLPSSAWETVAWREATRKTVRSRFAALRIRPGDSQ